MANTPDHITITVDEDALRAQVRKAIGDELRKVSQSLHQAADALDPSVIEQMTKWHYDEGFKAGKAAAESSAQGGTT